MVMRMERMAGDMGMVAVMMTSHPERKSVKSASSVDS